MKIEIYLDEEGVVFFTQVTDALLKAGGEANLQGVLLIKSAIKPWKEKGKNAEVEKNQENDNTDNGNKENKR